MENQTCFKIAGRDCAICWTAEGSKSCRHSATPQSGRISSLITDKFTPLLVIKIVNLHYQLQKTGQINDIKCYFQRSAISHDHFQHSVTNDSSIKCIGPVHMWLYDFQFALYRALYLYHLLQFWSIFVYHILFLWYFTHGISKTWIPLVFKFSWLWPVLLLISCVFNS